MELNTVRIDKPARGTGGKLSKLMGLAPVIAIAIAIGGCASKPEPRLSYGLSGYEIFPGNSSGSSVSGAIFSGWTHESESPWQGASSTGGTWSVSADYTGKPGLGSAVKITGGRWFLTVGEAVIPGSVTGGTIVWPSLLNSELLEYGCGQGVGYVTVSLTTIDGRKGSLAGCLDDTHVFLGTFPPKLWGTLKLS